MTLWRSILSNPFGLAVIGILLSTIWIGMSMAASPLWPLPNLALIVGYMILGKGTPLSETAALILLGLVSDILSGDLPGAGTLGMLAAAATIHNFVVRFDILRPRLKVYIFPLFAAIALTTEWLLSSIAGFSALPISGAILQLIATSLLYLVYAVFRQTVWQWLFPTRRRFGLLGNYE